MLDSVVSGVTGSGIVVDAAVVGGAVITTGSGTSNSWISGGNGTTPWMGSRGSAISGSTVVVVSSMSSLVVVVSSTTAVVGSGNGSVVTGGSATPTVVDVSGTSRVVPSLLLHAAASTQTTKPTSNVFLSVGMFNMGRNRTTPIRRSTEISDSLHG